MKSRYTLGVTLLAGAAIGSFATQGLHAQGGKQKVWVIAEIEPVAGASMPAATLKEIRDEIAKAHGTALRTVGGRVVHLEGADAPKRVAINEFPSMDDAMKFYSSEAWKKSASDRAKTGKTIRRYAVEAEP
jgi:uncharacterized protein (DUF1330 family)